MKVSDKMEKALNAVRALFPDSAILLLVASESTDQSTTISTGSNLDLGSQEALLEAALEYYEVKPEGESYQ